MLWVKPTITGLKHRNRTFSTFVAQLAKRIPAMNYPALNGFHVEMDGICGIGHRLHRNAQIYHSARSAGYAVRVIWFPWSELFEDTSDMFNSDLSHSPAFRFWNEAIDVTAVSLSGREPEITGYKELVIPECLNFDYRGSCDEGQWRIEVFGPAATDHVADFHLRLAQQLRPTYVDRLDRFLAEKIGGRRLVAIHIRTGNGETGHFVDKNRMVRATEIMAAFRDELERYPREDTVVFVASDSTEPLEFLKSQIEHDVVVFTMSLPSSGVVTGDWVSPNSSDDVALDSREDRIERMFEAYADMLLLGMADDLYAGAWSSFLAGPCLMNRRRADLGTTLSIYDAQAGRWRTV